MRAAAHYRSRALMLPSIAVQVYSVLDPAAQRHLVGVAGIDNALVVNRDRLRRSDLGGRDRDEGRHVAILGATEPDALLERRVALRIRLRVGDVKNIVLVDRHAARPAELLPLGEKFPVGIEDLHPAVDAIGDKHAARGIDGDAMGRIKLTLRLAVLAPRLDELAVLGKLHDAVVRVAAMAVGHEDVPVGGDHHIGRPVERVLTITRHAWLTDGQEDLALGAELDQHGTFAVLAALIGDVDVAFAVAAKAMREVEHAAAKARYEPAGRIKLHDRCNVRLAAIVGAAAIEHPQTLAVTIDLNSDRRAHFSTIGQLRPILLHLIRIGR